jgi:hypothetical protein
MAQGYYAYITLLDDPGGGGHPDQGLPGGGRPGHLPSRPGRPGGRPDQGLPGGGRPPHTWPRPPGGGLPVDPDWGVPEGGHLHPDHGLPIHPIDPSHPDNTLPDIPGVEPLPPDPPPGTVWPPLPPDVPPGRALALVAIEGVGYRYVVIEIGERPVDPDYGVEGPDDGGEQPSPQPPRPGVPPRPGQGLPGQRPPVAGQPLPPQRPGQPPQPGQGLPQPPTAQPKPVGRR